MSHMWAGSDTVQRLGAGPRQQVGTHSWSPPFKLFYHPDLPTANGRCRRPTQLPLVRELYYYNFNAYLIFLVKTTISSAITRS